MAKPTSALEWCIIRLGEDHNWWVAETSDPVRWDVDGLSIVDPRQVAHLIELVDALRDYGFHQDLFEAAFIPFRIEKDLGTGKVRLERVKESIFESEEKLFALPDILDEENGPYADLLDHLTRCRVKMLNDLFNFESKLTVDEVEDEIREEQNTHFIEGKAPAKLSIASAPTRATWAAAECIIAGSSPNSWIDTGPPSRSRGSMRSISEHVFTLP